MMDALSLAGDARRRTGFHDFGPDFDPAPLGILIDSLEGEARLNPVGRYVVRRALLQHLCNRLEVVEWLKRHPETSSTPIPNPVFITGLPRTGTTFLQELLRRLPGVSTLTTRTAYAPVIEFMGPVERRRKLVLLRLLVWLSQRMSPELAAIHPVSVDGAEECFALLCNAHPMEIVGAVARVPRFMAWCASMPAKVRHSGYVLYRRQLGILQRRNPGEAWVLKCPFHLFGLEAIAELFPGARVVHLVRDPGEVVPSLCSLLATARRMYTSHVSREEAGTEAMGLARRFCEATGRLDELFPGRVSDVGYREFAADPAGTVNRLSAWLGLPHGTEAMTRVRSWLAERARAGRPRHRYRAEDFGLETKGIRGELSAYCDRYGV